MTLALCAAGLCAAVAIPILARRGERLGKRRAYLMIICSALFFSSVFGGAGFFFAAIEKIRPGGLYAADITPNARSFAIPLNGSGEIALDVKNRGALTWDSSSESGPVFLSWHILNENGDMLRFENPRVAFPAPVSPGDSAGVAAPVSPSSDGLPAGRYIFEFDLVREGEAWFADRGSAASRVRVEVSR